MEDYILASSFNRANIQDRLWYAMKEADKDALLAKEKVSFGDKVYIISSKKVYILGNDQTWYPMS